MVGCNKMNKELLEAVELLGHAYTSSLRRYLATREYDRQLKTSGISTYLIWGFIDEYCFIQGMLNAKVMWNHDIFEDRSIQCPKMQWCRFRKLVK